MNTISGPVQPGQRIQIIDIWRGFALLGILLVNMAFFNHAVQEVSLGMAASGPISQIDQIASWFVAFFGEGKFYSIFSFLFGLGFAIQQQRAQEKGGRFVPVYLRRLLVLLGIGLIHAYLFWVGDILIFYSLLGIVLLIFFRNRRPKTLRTWFFILLIVPLLINGALWGIVELGKMAPGGEAMMAEVFAEQEHAFRQASIAANEIYATGTFAEITQQRVADMNYMYTVFPFIAFNILAMFVLGLYAGKQRLHETLPNDNARLRKILAWGLAIGVIGNLLYVVYGHMGSRIEPSLSLMLSITGQTFGAPALAMAYLAALALLAPRVSFLSRLAPVGRMALTNYLLQTVICVTLFYGYGFGLYGRIGQAGGLLLTAVIFLLQIPFSNWWLNRYRFGPMEWLWRCLTYRKMQPMRLKTA